MSKKKQGKKHPSKVRNTTVSIRFNAQEMEDIEAIQQVLQNEGKGWTRNDAIRFAIETVMLLSAEMEESNG